MKEKNEIKQQNKKMGVRTKIIIFLIFLFLILFFGVKYHRHNDRSSDIIFDPSDYEN